MRLDQEGPADPLARTQGFEAFYLRHFDVMTRFVARRVADPHTVADLTAEIFLAALHSRHTYRPGQGSETGWLYGVARNVLSVQRRRSEREARAVERVVARRLLDGDDIADLTDRIDAEEPARRALSAMADLPEGERALLELVVIDQLTVAEAAQALGIRVGTARVRLHRARRTLRKVPGVAAALVTEGL
ncbi:RNA polymerase sigma factor [Nonomuraea sp. NPDC049486]|uniref:RNA polymerase sigma factor n=1 Tax=Nonomuraea harbinensis TaxID=1286938 RepID=A0ABW1C8L9_9ACTN|nr:RNA polymerase sigma factor [Nonomuraea harbinensis]